MAPRIYTRTGDDGRTGLGDGTRVPKPDLRVHAYGSVDETSSVVGIALAHGAAPRTSAMLEQVQHELFDLGADLATPIGGKKGGHELRIDARYVQRLESWIDEVDDALPPLANFVLPGGTAGAAALHHARTVARRAEREVAALVASEPDRTNVLCMHYLNRLSDLLFVLARAANEGGRGDVVWKPGGGRDAD